MVKYADLHPIPEDDRITEIGIRAATQLVGVLVETDEPGKIDRYIKKVTERFPLVKHIDTTPGVTPKVSIVRFGPKRSN